MGDTKKNLEASIAGETHEYTDMYPGMARPRVTKGLTRSQTGSKHWPRPSAATPIASRRRWTTSTVNSSSRLNSIRGAILLPLFFPAHAPCKFIPSRQPAYQQRGG
jgi:hypothetical protein